MKPKSKSQARRQAAQEPDLFALAQKHEKNAMVKWALNELNAVNKGAASFLHGYITGLQGRINEKD